MSANTFIYFYFSWVHKVRFYLFIINIVKIKVGRQCETILILKYSTRIEIAVYNVSLSSKDLIFTGIEWISSNKSLLSSLHKHI